MVARDSVRIRTASGRFITLTGLPGKNCRKARGGAFPETRTGEVTDLLLEAQKEWLLNC